MEFARARDCFGIALEKDPSFVKAYPKKGDCHFFLKEYHKALEIYEAGLKLDPENELCKQGLMKTQQAIYSNNSQEDQEQRAKRAMSDPEIQAILQTPEVRNALADGGSEFLRPMPGSDRMYPETDLPLLKISRDIINNAKKDLPKLRSVVQDELSITTSTFQQNLKAKLISFTHYIIISHIYRMHRIAKSDGHGY